MNRGRNDNAPMANRACPRVPVKAPPREKPQSIDPMMAMAVRQQTSVTQPKVRMDRELRIKPPHCGHVFTMPSTVKPQDGDMQVLLSAISPPPRPPPATNNSTRFAA